MTAWGESLLYFIVLLGLLWWWRASAQARELASASAKTLCEREGVQFLDGTASLASLGLIRVSGRLGVRRTFNFAYSESGEDRQRGSMILVGTQVTAFVLKGRTTLETE